MFIHNLYAFIAAHGVECSIIGAAIAVRIPCTLHTGARYITTTPVTTYAQARALLGY